MGLRAGIISLILCLESNAPLVFADYTPDELELWDAVVAELPPSAHPDEALQHGRNTYTVYSSTGAVVQIIWTPHSRRAFAVIRKVNANKLTMEQYSKFKDKTHNLTPTPNPPPTITSKLIDTPLRRYRG